MRNSLAAARVSRPLFRADPPRFIAAAAVTAFEISKRGPNKGRTRRTPTTLGQRLVMTYFVRRESQRASSRERVFLTVLLLGRARRADTPDYAPALARARASSRRSVMVTDRRVRVSPCTLVVR